MFILQISATTQPVDIMPRFTPPQPSSSPPSAQPDDVMPRFSPSSPTSTSDSWTPVLNRIEQQRIISDRKFTRLGLPSNRTPVGQVITSLLGTDLTYNEDGSFSRPGDTRRYYFQPDGSIFRSSGYITLPNGTVQQTSPETLRNPSNPQSRWDSSNNGNQMIIGTQAINRLDLIPGGQGAFIKPGENNSGKYFVQSDGSIFYEGGTVGGQRVSAKTYENINGNWRWNTGRNTAMPGTLDTHREIEYYEQHLRDTNSSIQTANQFISEHSDGRGNLILVRPNGQLNDQTASLINLTRAHLLREYRTMLPLYKEGRRFTTVLLEFYRLFASNPEIRTRYNNNIRQYRTAIQNTLLNLHRTIPLDFNDSHLESLRNTIRERVLSLPR